MYIPIGEYLPIDSIVEEIEIAEPMMVPFLDGCCGLLNGGSPFQLVVERIAPGDLQNQHHVA